MIVAVEKFLYRFAQSSLSSLPRKSFQKSCTNNPAPRHPSTNICCAQKDSNRAIVSLYQSFLLVPRANNKNLCHRKSKQCLRFPSLHTHQPEHTLKKIYASVFFSFFERARRERKKKIFECNSDLALSVT